MKLRLFLLLAILAVCAGPAAAIHIDCQILAQWIAQEETTLTALEKADLQNTIDLNAAVVALATAKTPQEVAIAKGEIAAEVAVGKVYASAIQNVKANIAYYQKLQKIYDCPVRR